MAGRKPYPKKLENCRWCGGKVLKGHCDNVDGSDYAQHCGCCYASGPHRKTRREAMEAWNAGMRIWGRRIKAT
jgi:hypothetical protein